jgi:NifU-like protein involved in Fe-S cluster formation
MDDVIIKVYRHLLQNGFENTGSIEHPSIFLDTKLEGIPICGQAAKDYMNIYIMIEHNKIEDIKYLCFCDPVANVVVETLCNLVKGKMLEDVKTLTEADFTRTLGSNDDTLQKKAGRIIELFNRGIKRFEHPEK